MIAISLIGGYFNENRSNKYQVRQLRCVPKDTQRVLLSMSILCTVKKEEGLTTLEAVARAIGHIQGRIDAKREVNNQRTIGRVRSPNNVLTPSLSIFKDIVGHDGVKEIFTMAINSSKPQGVLLVGPPGCGKTTFLDKIRAKYNKEAYFAIGSTATKAGLLDKLFEKRPKYLCIDEIETMDAYHQTVLLSLMQSGVLSETKRKITRETKMNTWVFATCNKTDRLLPPLMDRFTVMYFKPYTREEIIEIGRSRLAEEYKIKPELADYITGKILDSGSVQFRDVMKVAGLMPNRSEAAVDRVIEIMGGYKQDVL